MRAKHRLLESTRDARATIFELRSKTHVRRDDEYVRPDQDLQMISWALADTFDLWDERSLNEVPMFWGGLRGAQYHDPYALTIPYCPWVKTWGELVPEPFNKHDDHALAVDVDGRRVGYASAGYASYVHPKICALNNLGYRVLVPTKLKKGRDPFSRLVFLSGYAAFPTLNEIGKYLPSDEESIEMLEPLWFALDEPTRAQIARDGWRLSDETLPNFIALRHLAPQIGLPSKPRLTAVPDSVDRFLNHTRKEEWRVRSLQRIKRNEAIVQAAANGQTKVDIASEFDLSPHTVAKILRDGGFKSRPKESASEKQRTDEEIAKLLSNGATRKEIKAALKVSHHRITQVAKEYAPSDIPRTGVNAHAREAMKYRLEASRRALEAFESGKTRTEVATMLQISPDTVKRYLADARFFANPEQNPERLGLAQLARLTNATRSQAQGTAEKRAISDANMLDLIGADWLGQDHQ